MRDAAADVPGLTGLAPASARPRLESSMRADALFGQVEEFQALSAELDISMAEQLTLLQSTPDIWSRWRRFDVEPDVIAPALFVRRLDYAISLLRRMQGAMGGDPAA